MSEASAPTELRGTVDAAIGAGADRLFALQWPDGYWWAELESNVSITAEHLFLRHILGIFDPEEARAAATDILRRQRADGTWANWHDGPGELSTTVEAYLALRMAGHTADEPEMAKARAFILSCGGVERVRVFTKIWLAMMGEWDWRGVPILPAEFVLLPRWFPVSIYSFGCWARQTIVPMAIIMDRRPVFPLPEGARIDELFARGRGAADLSIRPAKRSWRSRAFLLLDRLLRLHERIPWKPLRRRALAFAERWILDRQEADGAWGGIQPPWVYSLIALRLRGHSLDEGPLHDGFAAFYGPQGFAIREEEAFRLQSCLSPVWDTALAAVALADAGVDRRHPAVVRAAEWLAAEQIATGGDWQVRCRARPGGWAFEFDNDIYPDTDDTAIVLMALLGADMDGATGQDGIARGLEWLLGMQSRNGGWGAFDRNNTQTWTRQIPFCDFGEVIDPPSADVTGHVIECLGRFGRRIGDPRVDRAVRFLKREQDPDGAWFGRWGVNLTYGIGAVLPGLEAVGEKMTAPYVRRAVAWLLDHQNDDGGWGEKIEGYYDPAWRGRGRSTASQTAWALLGLLAGGEAGHEATSRGIDYLVRTQKADGGWDEEAFTGSGFPTDFMIRYHIYRDVFPLMALGRYRRATEAKR
jgi:squalene-hopene/tetraprenyl-beta-curcumene cyclase